MNLPVFSYGTLRDPQYQRELFGRTFAQHPARVHGYAALAADGGYLVACASAQGTLEGALVALDAEALAIADAWEDLAVYRRIVVDAHTDDGTAQRAYLYIVDAARGAPAAPGVLATRDRAAVIADIRRFRAERERDRRG